MKEVELSQGKVALIDDEDYQRVSEYRWFARKGYGTFYAQTKDVNGFNMDMHRFILGLTSSDLEVDHKNGNGLDNRRSNIREATSQDNKRNRAKSSGKSSKFKGVCWDKERQRWLAHITIDYKFKYLGRFDSEEDAARAYDAAARVHFGEFARPNFGRGA